MITRTPLPRWSVRNEVADDSVSSQSVAFFFRFFLPFYNNKKKAIVFDSCNRVSRRRPLYRCPRRPSTLLFSLMHFRVVCFFLFGFCFNSFASVTGAVTSSVPTEMKRTKKATPLSNTHTHTHTISKQTVCVCVCALVTFVMPIAKHLALDGGLESFYRLNEGRNKSN